MRGAMLYAAGLLTGLAVQVGIAQNASGGVVMMNHVGINVPDIAEAVTYYTQKMGYHEAFRANDEKGQPRLVYMQISKNTFLELNPANAQRPAGFTHYGLHVENAKEAVARFRKNGVDGDRHKRQRYESDPGQHHRPLHGPHRACRAHPRVPALQSDPELEMKTMKAPSIALIACRWHRAAGNPRPDAAARRHRADGQGPARQQRREPVSRHSRLGTTADPCQAVGRLERRRHRQGRQVRVGDRSMFAGDGAGLSRDEREPGSPFRRIGQRDQELWRRACSCGRTASTSIATATCGSPTPAPRAPTSSRSFPVKTRREASSSSSAPTARS